MVEQSVLGNKKWKVHFVIQKVDIVDFSKNDRILNFIFQDFKIRG